MAGSGYCPIYGKYIAVLHLHHIIPREYGGENGPTINISPDAHESLHRSVENNKIKAQFLESLIPNKRPYAQYLINNIIESKTKFKEVGNKTKHNINVEVSTTIYNKLKIIARERGLSIRKLIGSLITNMVNR